MIHPDTAIVSVGDAIGDGVVATALIPRGTIVWARDAADRVLSPAEVAALPAAERAHAERYGYRDRWGATIVCADAGRLVNHSCEPSIRGIDHDTMIAVRDIFAGDEITCDYAECNLCEPLICACGTPSCRGRIMPDDLLRYAAAWDLEVRAAIARGRFVAQPVVPFALDPAAVRAVLDGARAPIPLADVALRADAGADARR